MQTDVVKKPFLQIKDTNVENYLNDLYVSVVSMKIHHGSSLNCIKKKQKSNAN